MRLERKPAERNDPAWASTLTHDEIVDELHRHEGEHGHASA